ncbi:hypothetical protein F5X71_00385 [Nocardia brasiliensis]|uniref:DUF3168 domain-containing protein n=1 Tax=Nocardia brasiliensis TaxID=37326 RepID=A0A6G9XJA0_NOCBR|nr:hypothetical protein [Nocardia brasiliensis]QIS00989.1 hypothetical protein F5X71_00385 [Nocardia brasiliensis]
MSKPLRLPGDPARAIKDYLAAVLPGLVVAPAPTVGMVLPAAWKPASPPAVVVFDDGGPVRWPVTTAPTVRVTVWANGRDRSRAIAGRCLGVLLSHRIPGVATITQPSSLLEALDSNNSGVMTSFTVRALARTLAL